LIQVIAGGMSITNNGQAYRQQEDNGQQRDQKSCVMYRNIDPAILSKPNCFHDGLYLYETMSINNEASLLFAALEIVKRILDLDDNPFISNLTTAFFL
jgi:hypothetical protein